VPYNFATVVQPVETYVLQKHMSETLYINIINNYYYNYNNNNNNY